MESTFQQVHRALYPCHIWHYVEGELVDDKDVVRLRDSKVMWCHRSVCHVVVRHSHLLLSVPSVCVRVCACVCVCMYVCMYLSIYLSIFLFIYQRHQFRGSIIPLDQGHAQSVGGGVLRPRPGDSAPTY
jgi:hypothetical protein